MKLEITADGKLYLDSYRSLAKAILLELYSNSLTVYKLVESIRNKYEEFKYLNIKTFVTKIAELVREHLIVVHEEED